MLWSRGCPCPPLPWAAGCAALPRALSPTPAVPEGCRAKGLVGGNSGVCGAAPAGSGYWEKVGGSPELGGGGGGWGLCCGAVSSPCPVQSLLPQFPKQRERAILPGCCVSLWMTARLLQSFIFRL